MPNLCATCEYWQGNKGRYPETSGECRRHAPQLSVFDKPDYMQRGHWPYTGSSEGCGDYELMRKVPENAS